MRDHLKLCSLAVLAFTAVLLAYSNHFHNSFHFDDSHTIETNLSIRSLSNIPSFFTDGSKFSALPANQGYRPILTSLNAVEYWAGGGDVFVFHLSSFFFYVILCIVYYFMLLRLFDIALPSRGNRFACLVITAIYAVHTVNAETVNYISARSDSLSSLMAVAALTTYMYGHRRRLFYLVPLAFGLLTKPTLAVFPLLLLAYMLLFEEKLSLGDLVRRRNLSVLGRCAIKTAPAWIVSLALLGLSSAMTPKSFTPSHVSPFDYALTQPQALLHYFVSFFVPSGLSGDIEFQAMSGIFDERVVIGSVFIALMLILAVRTSRMEAQRPISFGVLWFFIASIPTSCGLIPLAESMNDHRMFFPFIGLMMSVSWPCRLFLQNLVGEGRHGGLWKCAAALVLVSTFVGHAWGTHLRNEVWRDEESLWYDVTVKRPANGRGLMNYGVVKMAGGDYPTAMKYFERALIYVPHYSFLHVNLGILKEAMGDRSAAEAYFKNAIALARSSPYSYYYYARSLDRQGRASEAAELLKSCLGLSPGYTDARYLLMDVYARLSRYEELKELAVDTLRLSPGDAKAMAYLTGAQGVGPGLLRRESEAKERATVQSYLDLSLACYRSGRFEDSVKASEQALSPQKDCAAA